MRIATAICFSIGLLSAQSGLDRPTLGTMLDANGTTRMVYGIAGSVTLGDAGMPGVLSMACSRTLCLIKTDASIIAAGQAVDAPPGPALFALDVDAALVYFPQSKQLARWHDNQLDPVDFAIDGEILSIRVTAGTLEYAVRVGERRWIVDSGNRIVNSIPGANGPVMLLKSAVVFATADRVAIRRPDGVEMQFDVAGASAFLALGEGYAQVRAAGANYLLRVEAGREQIFLLPEPSQ